MAEKIRLTRGSVTGERKQVTVFFADPKGSMELLADRDPEEARRILDPVLERVMEAVHRYEGTVNRVMGDGIMALFGAPLALEDHAVRACYAALRMQAEVKGYAREALLTIVLPIGQSEIGTSLRCAQANGMPIMVIARPMAVMMWPRASHQPASRSQIRLPIAPSGPVPRSS